MKLLHQLERLKVKSVMSSPRAVGNLGDTLSEALGKMKKYELWELPVLENNKLVGIVSYSTLTKRRQITIATSVENIMVTPPKISPTDTLTKLAELLLTTDFRSIPVTTKDRLVGVVSRSDMIKVIKDIRELSIISVDTIMTPNPLSIRDDDTVAKARRLMDSLDETTLPVVDAHERLVGMIDAKDLASVVLPIARKKGKEFIGGKYPMEIYVKSLMSHAPPAVDPDASLGEIVELMLSHKLHSIVITRNELPVGIITQLDLVELIASYGKRKGVYVQITGLEEGDPDIYDAIYSIIQKSMARINKLLKPDILTVHVAQQRQKGLVARYSIHAKLVAIGRTFYGRFEAWDLLRTVSGALDHIEKQIRKRAERKKHREKLRKRVQGRTRRKRREANISLSPLF